MPEPNCHPIPSEPDPSIQPGAGDPLTPKEQADLADAALQAAYRQAYLNQLRRQACPGCGETDILG